MIFYSILTFFLAPYLTSIFMKDHSDPSIVGFFLGFTISILLWMKFGRNL